MNHKSSTSGDDFSDSAYEFNQFISNSNRSQRMREQALLAIYGALKGLSLECDRCGEICEHQAVRIRDAFMLRARELIEVMSRGITIYAECRNYGIDEPECIDKIYNAWNELAILFDYLELQNHISGSCDEEQEGESEEEDIDH